MNSIKLAFAVSVAAALSACGSVDVVTRDAPFEAGAAIAAQAPADSLTRTAEPAVTQVASTGQGLSAADIMTKINVAQINVSVPEKLKVSEANSYYPKGDIVWRGDPIGNRHAQIATIFQDALGTGTRSFQGPVPVTLDIEVERFHAVTEKARYTVGGVHSIRFKMQLRDASTGELLSSPRVVEADLDAFGGQQAINAEARGDTQKVRISNHLAEVIRQELTRADGYESAKLGFYQLVNKI